jgi:hypothetical protein
MLGDDCSSFLIREQEQVKKFRCIFNGQYTSTEDTYSSNTKSAAYNVIYRTQQQSHKEHW